MAWTDIFRSRYVRFLEAELNAARKKHIEELERIKNLHADELNRCMVETNRAWGEVDRLRQYLIPNMPIADRSPQTSSEAPAVDEVPHGTPFQRLMRQSFLEQEAAAKAEVEKKKETEKQNATSN